MKKKWTACFSLALIFATALDIISTYAISPDLSLEANLFCVIIGHNWSYILSLKVGLTLIAVFAFTKSLRILQLRMNRLAGERGFLNVLSQLVFKRHLRLREFLLYACPTDWISVFAIVAITFGMSMITGGIMAGTLNTFKIVQSKSQHIILCFCNAVLALGFSLWLTYRFLAKQQKAEPEIQDNPADAAL